MQNMGKNCMDIESGGNESQQSEDEKLASPMEVDDEKSPDESQKLNSNIIECFERSNISFLDFFFEFAQLLVSFLCQNTKFVHF